MSETLLIAVLAAGASRRLGQPKQLVKLRGETLLHRQCRTALDAKLGAVTAVLGCRAKDCAAAIGDLAVSVQFNCSWKEGMASSLRVAAQAGIDAGVAGLLILQCDQYLVTAADLGSMHNAWVGAGRSGACRARHGEYRGPPVILPAACLADVLQLRGEEGARNVLRRLVPDRVMDVSMPNADKDLDDPEQLMAVEALNREVGSE